MSKPLNKERTHKLINELIIEMQSKFSFKLNVSDKKLIVVIFKRGADFGMSEITKAIKCQED